MSPKRSAQLGEASSSPSNPGAQAESIEQAESSGPRLYGSPQSQVRLHCEIVLFLITINRSPPGAILRQLHSVKDHRLQRLHVHQSHGINPA